VTPAARVAAAIEVLDDIFAGQTAEKALTGWGRAHRFAGSKDRAAIRDHVFQALRCRASYAWLGGPRIGSGPEDKQTSETGRAVMIGAMRAAGQLDAMFTGDGHAPAPLASHEGAGDLAAAPRATALDVQDWMLPLFDASFGARADDILTLMQHRAGLFLRVNAARTTRDAAQALLLEDGITTQPLDSPDHALVVVDNERRVARAAAYLDGLVEIQDPSSQHAVEALALSSGDRVLDYCAGGGGKSLAMAAYGAQVTAHDINPRRMVDIAPRAGRAGVLIEQCTTDALAQMPPFDIVFCDAPCSGSGTWRRAPEAKWALSQDRLTQLTEMQDDVLSKARSLVRRGGRLIYATCSVFECENVDRVDHFLTLNPQFSCVDQTVFAPHGHGDGFYFAQLRCD